MTGILTILRNRALVNIHLEFGNIINVAKAIKSPHIIKAYIIFQVQLNAYMNKFILYFSNFYINREQIEKTITEKYKPVHTVMQILPSLGYSLCVVFFFTILASAI